jgi:hypothetical protein
VAYYEDLSGYTYFANDKSGAKNVGWLERGHEFERASPINETLDILWSFCKIRVMQTRGWHQCDICVERKQVTHARRNGLRLWLGTAEVRVFAADGTPYAAPDLVYHYVRAHNYLPPEEFLLALREGPRPPSEDYFGLLRKNALEWREAKPADPHARGLEVKKVSGQARRTDIELEVHLDLD